MTEQDLLALRFEEHRTHLQRVAFRMLGSVVEAEDAVQEAWIRLGRSETGEIENLRGWLTTVVARVCLDALRSRNSRREETFEAQEPEPSGGRSHERTPEDELLLADAVGAALMVVLEALAPAERVARPSLDDGGGRRCVCSRSARELGRSLVAKPLDSRMVGE